MLFLFCFRLACVQTSPISFVAATKEIGDVCTQASFRRAKASAKRAKERETHAPREGMNMTTVLSQVWKRLFSSSLPASLFLSPPLFYYFMLLEKLEKKNNNKTQQELPSTSISLQSCLTGVLPSRAPVLSCAHYFQAPATQAVPSAVHSTQATYVLNIIQHFYFGMKERNS